jgi:hypothetical protein
VEVEESKVKVNELMLTNEQSQLILVEKIEKMQEVNAEVRGELNS